MTHPVTGFLEGLMSGGQTGVAFRWARDDRRQAQAAHADDQAYEKARRLREEVAFALQQQVGQAQLDQLQGPHFTEVSPGATLHDPTGRAPDYTAPGREPSPLVQDWEREGFPTQQAWQDYHKLISRAGTGADRGQLTPAERTKMRLDLMKNHDVYNPATFQWETRPGMSAADADRKVREAENGPAPALRGAAPPNPWSGRGMGAGGTPQAAPSRANSGPPATGSALNADALGSLADAVIAEHPEWSDEQVSAEVRKRAGLR